MENTNVRSTVRRVAPARERRAAPAVSRGGELVTVAGSPQTVLWLSRMARESGLSWRVRELGRGASRGILVLPHPEDYPELLRHWTGLDRVVVSLDCPQGRSLALSGRVKTFTFSEGRDCADLTAKDLRMTPHGLRFVAVTKTELARVCVEPEDLYPALSALACGVWLGVPLERAAEAVSVSAAGARGKIIQMA